MYDAKEAGRDRLAVYDVQAPRHERMQHEPDLGRTQIESALENDRFVLYAQPILSMDDDGRAPLRAAAADAWARMAT